MAYESIKVDIIPGAENAEVLHFSQYDNKRPFFIELFNGGAKFIPEAGMSLSLECRKRDGNIVIISDYTLTDNVAEFSTTEQLTACYGDNMAEIKIVDDNDLVIGSANFIINVEKSPTCGGLTSESEIDNLTQQIEDITQQVIGDDYYTKVQTDALLENKADKSELPDMTDYYTKDQTYSSSQIDTALSYKADASVLSDYALKEWVTLNFVDAAYLGAHYYTKHQVDDLLFKLMPVGSASGNPCSFNTEIAAPLHALTADIVCGGGGGTHSTPIPLVGHSELNLTRCGVNLFDEDRLLNATDWSKSGDYYVGSVGQLYTLFNVNGDFWHSESGVDSLCVSYTAYVDNVNVNARAEFYYSDGTTSLAGVINGSTPTDYTAVSTSGKTVIAIKWNFSNDATLHIKDFSINYPSSKTAYEPYNGQTFTVAFGQTVYGGVYDNSGRLTITWGAVNLGSLNWSKSGSFANRFIAPLPDIKQYELNIVPNIKCSIYKAVSYNDASQSDYNVCTFIGGGGKSIAITDSRYGSGSADDFKTAMNGILLAYELATPIVIDVPSISVFAENGVNNIISDGGGDVNVSYKDTIQHYIDSRI